MSDQTVVTKMSVLNPRKLPAILWVFPSELDGYSPAMPCSPGVSGRPSASKPPCHSSQLSCPLPAVIVMGMSSPDWGRILPKECGLTYNCIRTTRGETYRVGPQAFFYSANWASFLGSDVPGPWETPWGALSGMLRLDILCYLAWTSSQRQTQNWLWGIYIFLISSLHPPIRRNSGFILNKDLSVVTIVALFHLSIPLSINHVSSSFCVSGNYVGLCGT